MIDAIDAWPRTERTQPMIKRLLVLSLIAAASAASAQQRPYAPQLSCATAAGLVAAQGAVVFGTGPYTYERIVRDGGLCAIEETIVPASARTADQPQ